MAGLGVLNEAYLFQVYCRLHVVTFGPSMYFLELELSIYKIMLGAQGSKGLSSVLLPIQDRYHASGQILSLTISYSL